MNVVLFDDESQNHMLPLTYLRPLSEIRMGIFNFRERWENFFQFETSWLTKHYLREKYPLIINNNNIFINGRVIANHELAKCIMNLNPNELLIHDNTILAIALSRNDVYKRNLQTLEYLRTEIFEDLKAIKYNSQVIKIEHPWHLFQFNNTVLKNDFEYMRANRQSKYISSTNTLIGSLEDVFVEHDAIVECSVINTKEGPVYIGKGVEVMEMSCLRGPVALCDKSSVKIGTKIYGSTTIGPYCKVGGEISNSVFIGYSNKVHDGFVGDSVIAEWCNLGAGTNFSNLKNTYDQVKIWSFSEKRFVETGLQFCGTIMGDHSKTGINTMLNTGTVIGVSANIFGSGYPRQYIPSFAWGGATGFIKYQFEKAIETARRVCARRNVILSDVDIEILRKIYEMS